MEREHSLILDELARSVVEMDKDRAREAATVALRMKVDPYLAIMQGLAKGMDKVNELYEAEEYFVPEILVCADAMYAGIEVLRPYLPKEEAGSRKKVVIGVMKGDTHDIGKNLVKILLDNAGFRCMTGRDGRMQACGHGRAIAPTSLPLHPHDPPWTDGGCYT